MNEHQTFIFALTQLIGSYVMGGVSLAAVVFLAVDKALPPGATVTLVTLVLAHMGLSTFNGIKQAQQRSNGNGTS